MEKPNRWIFIGFKNGLMQYECSNCGYVKTVMKPGFNASYIKIKRYVARCPNCGALNTY